MFLEETFNGLICCPHTSEEKEEYNDNFHWRVIYYNDQMNRSAIVNDVKSSTLLHFDFYIYILVQ